MTGNVSIKAIFTEVDKSALLNAIMAAELIDTEHYMEYIKGVLDKALSDAFYVADNPEATYEEVNAATEALTNAMNNFTDDHKQRFVVHFEHIENGTAWVNKPFPIYGEAITIKAIPNAGFALYKISVNGVQVNSREVRNITSHLNITVQFKSTNSNEVTLFRSDHYDILRETVSTLSPDTIMEYRIRVNEALTDYIKLSSEYKRQLAPEYQLLMQLMIHLDNLEKANDVSVMIMDIKYDKSMA